jgi:hypothetical protein
MFPRETGFGLGPTELGRFCGCGYGFVFGLETGGINMARVFPLDFRCGRIK